jgi:hypothetical protein
MRRAVRVPVLLLLDGWVDVGGWLHLLLVEGEREIVLVGLVVMRLVRRLVEGVLERTMLLAGWLLECRLGLLLGRHRQMMLLALGGWERRLVGHSALMQGSESMMGL